MSRYAPPLTLTTRMLGLIADISEQIGQLSAVNDHQQQRENGASLANPDSQPVEADYGLFAG
ncbi:hypothetical protein ACOXXE_09220 [Pseudomonas mediterranea]|uniref:hypothetical protein n=1 Tax=Pseudomonas mediterranea TaxID=183795 RepID=UPI003BF5EE0B